MQTDKLDRVIKNVRENISRVRLRMRILLVKMRCEDDNGKFITEYLELNEKLRKYKIYEAEFLYSRNKL